MPAGGPPSGRDALGKRGSNHCPLSEGVVPACPHRRVFGDDHALRIQQRDGGQGEGRRLRLGHRAACHSAHARTCVHRALTASARREPSRLVLGGAARLRAAVGCLGGGATSSPSACTCAPLSWCLAAQLRAACSCLEEADVGGCMGCVCVCVWGGGGGGGAQGPGASADQFVGQGRPARPAGVYRSAAGRPAAHPSLRL